MKSFVLWTIVTASLGFSACNNAGDNQEEKSASATDAAATQAASHVSAEPKEQAGLQEVVADYFRLKNELANDNGKGAAQAGKDMVTVLNKVNPSDLPLQQQKVYQDMADDLRENAQHIGANADKIAHQREHFELLSQDMYDLIKVTGAPKTLYKDFCPMYNNQKGAYWISETKDIQNPYLGKKMATCGEVKEEIK